MPRFVTLDQDEKMSAVLKVVGVGGGGCNAINSMIKRGLNGVEFIAVNTDAQVLELSKADHKIQVGKNITRGLGAGADPNVGRQAHEEDREALTKVLEGSDMVFVTAGMGGGTGTGGGPIVASIAKSIGALVIGIITKPFGWEGKKRMINANEGINELRQYVDSLIIIPNERLLNILDNTISASTAFDKPNEVLYEATRGIADIITIPGIINVDFADVRSVMNSSGEALMGCGIASGENRAIEAAQKAISSPLLEGVNIKGAKNILLNVTGSENMTMQEIDEGNKVIYEAAGEEANVIFGWVNKEEMKEYVSYTVIATGFDSQSNRKKSHLDEHLKEKNEMEQREPIKKKKAVGDYPIYGGNSYENSDDLNVPTFFRINRSKKMNEEENDATSGFKYDQIDAFEEGDSPVKGKSDDNDKGDNSSFLRMMMD
ncbi:MAG: cell division protein FtsZ [Melioribacteraceae bacterium]|nr:cell division protein FtsZ [Melioribacteraceae bacterium]MCF8264216.1 cell division protein FtsZ [Melioribacteraceae bacterium]MCF8412186.1 cell division protein FtsZ [Melioribacteraceae bacterium]